MAWLYRTGLGAYHLGIRMAARLGNERAIEWLAGRELDVSGRLEALHADGGRSILWLHVASLGEFEQGRPVLEAFRAERPDWAVVVTFFSPSGYKRCRTTDLAELVAYLPEDDPISAEKWIALVRPQLAVFVKYEFWYFHLRALKRAGVPTFLIAGSFRAEQAFFRWYGGTWRLMLDCFTRFAVQTAADKELLSSLGHQNVSVTGDPRIDRTAALAQAEFHDPRLADFTHHSPTLLAGSVWPADVDVIAQAWPKLSQHWKLILAPHQLKEDQLAKWTVAFAADRYTGADNGSRVLILDTIGILSRAYRYGKVAFVGGGYGSGGLHNTLEPLSYGLPVLFGPVYHKFPEAVAAVAEGGAFPIKDGADLVDRMNWLADPVDYAGAAEAQRKYLSMNVGAAARTVRLLLGCLVFLILCSQPLAGQGWPPADRLTATLNDVFTKCNLMVAVSAVDWRPGLCLAGAQLSVGQSVSLQIDLEAGKHYVFIAGGERGTADLDLYLRDSTATEIAADSEDDDTPVVEYSIIKTGTYTLQLHLVSGAEERSMAGVGMLVSNGWPQTKRRFTESSVQFAAAAGAVRAAGGAKVFRYGPGSWCVYGYLLDSGEGATIAGLSLQAGRQFFTATGPESAQDIDLYLAGADGVIHRFDRDRDAFPMIDYTVPVAGPYLLRVEVARARDRGLVLLGLFTD